VEKKDCQAGLVKEVYQALLVVKVNLELWLRLDRKVNPVLLDHLELVDNLDSQA
jgi:hypothetical protein